MFADMLPSHEGSSSASGHKVRPQRLGLIYDQMHDCGRQGLLRFANYVSMQSARANDDDPEPAAPALALQRVAGKC